MRRARSLSARLVLLSLVVPSAASALTPGPGVESFTVDSGCLYDDPAGFYRLTKIVQGQLEVEWVFLVDEDGNGSYEAWCEGTATGSPQPVPTSGTTSIHTCASGIVATLTSGCAFDIDIWVGSSVDDNDGSSGVGPVDCSGNADPLLMLGLDGADKLRGSNHGDAMHGGEGEDTLEGYPLHDHICGGGDGDTVRAGDGDDWGIGGEGGDDLGGGANQDILAGGGSEDGPMSGDGDEDNVRGGGKDDDLLGGAQVDLLHGALSINADTFDGGTSTDKIVSFDGVAETTITSGDECWRDSGDSSCSSLTSHVMAVQSLGGRPLVVATKAPGGSGTAFLFELEISGGDDAAEQGKVYEPGASPTAFATEITGLAIEPGGTGADKLYALATYPGPVQKLVRIDLGAQPVSCTGGYCYEVEADWTLSRELIDIAIDSRGAVTSRPGLFGLTDDALMVQYDLSGSGSEVGTAPVGRNAQWQGGTHVPTAYAMAFDDIELGWFIVTTADPDQNLAANEEYSVFDGFDLIDDQISTAASIPIEDHILASKFGQAPFTFMHDDSAGSALTLVLENGHWYMVDIERQNWYSSRFRNGNTCPTPACEAEVPTTHEFTAITLPHYY